MQAQAAQEPFMDTLAALLQDEMDRRHSRLMARRFNPKLPRAACFELHTLKFLGEGAKATTILDRLMHRCAMLEFGGKSYRLKEAAARLPITSDPA
jgi:hypothetical protein